MKITQIRFCRIGENIIFSDFENKIIDNNGVFPKWVRKSVNSGNLNYMRALHLSNKFIANNVKLVIKSPDLDLHTSLTAS